MIISYQVGRAPRPQPALRGSLFRHRPITAARITGPAGTALRDGLLDTGADDTIFPEKVAATLGIDLISAPRYTVNLAGRGPVICRYATVLLRITDAVQETYEWPALVGFIPTPLQNALLGHAGFLEFFDTTFLGADRQVVITPNRAFPGRRI